jgi:hypothetical protein
MGGCAWSRSAPCPRGGVPTARDECIELELFDELVVGEAAGGICVVDEERVAGVSDEWSCARPVDPRRRGWYRDVGTRLSGVVPRPLKGGAWNHHRRGCLRGGGSRVVPALGNHLR